MNCAIIRIDRGNDVKPQTGIALKKRINAPYFLDLRRNGVADAAVLVAPSVFL